MLFPLMIIGPLLLGWGLYELFNDDDDNSNNGSDDQNQNNTPSDGPNLLIGNDEGNLISGQGGNDTIEGRGGNDTLHGDSGFDQIDGQAGDDRLFGGEGKDTVNGGAGNDIVFGGVWNDVLSGGVDDDILSGDKGNDQVSGDAGNDTLFGGIGSDTLSGGAGNDYLMGGAGADTIDGGEGNDTIVGINLTDTNKALDGVAGKLDSYADFDAAKAALAKALEGTNSELATIVDRDSGDLLQGGDGNDSIIAGANDTLTGGAGSDVFNIVSALETPNGSTGPVTITDFNSSEDSLVLTIQTDRFDTGGASDDAFFKVTTQATADGTGTAVYLNGKLYATLEGVKDFAAENITRVYLDGNTPTDTNSATQGPDRLVGDDEANNISGLGGSDTILGRGGDDTLSGNEGSDIVDGQSGNDTLRGDAGKDTLLGGAGDDFILGGGWHDTLSGGVGGDVLLGNAGNDKLSGNAGDDALYGGEGADVLKGGADSDNLYGGFGADTLDGGKGDDIIIGLHAPQFESNIDTLSESVASSAITPEAVATLQTFESDIQAKLATLKDTDNGDVILAGDGDDTIIAGRDDTITAGAGSDTVTILTAIERDNGVTGPVTITDFNTAEDRLVISIQTQRFDTGGASNDDFFKVTTKATGDGSGSEVYLNGKLYATLNGVQNLNAADVNRVYLA